MARLEVTWCCHWGRWNFLSSFKLGPYWYLYLLCDLSIFINKIFYVFVRSYTTWIWNQFQNFVNRPNNFWKNVSCVCLKLFEIHIVVRSDHNIFRKFRFLKQKVERLKIILSSTLWCLIFQLTLCCVFYLIMQRCALYAQGFNLFWR